MTLPADIPTPVFVLDVARLRQNLETAKRVREEAGCKVLLATKAFAMPAAFPVMTDYLDGTTASGEHEAIMGKESFGKEVHVYSPAYTEETVRNLTKIAGHIYFNSAAQLVRFGDLARDAGAHVGLRVNPGYSNATLGGDLYNPTAPMSRFGEVPAKRRLVRRRHLPRPRPLREPARRLGWPDQPCRRQFRAIYRTGLRREFRRRAFPEQAGL